AIALSGLYLFLAPSLLSFPDSSVYGALYRTSVLLHAAAVYLILMALVAHIYFSTVEHRPALEGMRSGYLSLEFLRRERPLWYQEIVERYRSGESSVRDE
ncbi:formate dehydrogenase, partial [Rhodovibrio sodomensis]